MPPLLAATGASQPSAMTADAKAVRARAFVRSLNLLLKSVRLYGLDHSRCAGQLKTAWDELRVLGEDSSAGFLLGVTGSQILLDGVPLNPGPAERSFAEMFSTAGLASMQFSPQVTEADFRKFVGGFGAGSAKSNLLAQQLKTALADVASIRVNEVRFVAEDPAAAGSSLAGQLAGNALGAQAADVQAWLRDPHKLLQILAAAQATRSGVASEPCVPEPMAESDVNGLLRMLTQLAKPTHSGEASASLPQAYAGLPATSQEYLRQAIAAMAASTPARPEAPVMLQLAEHLAIRFALERFERGEVRVNAVREMLERSSRELETLRKILGAYEEKMSRAGMAVESHTDVMDRQFWANVPEGGKRTVLLSSEAWCIPPRNIRQFVEQLLKKGDVQNSVAILLNYASCVGSPELEARRKTALGLCELAHLYTQAQTRLLDSAVRCVAEQLRQEDNPELQTLLATAFTRLSEEAGAQRDYATLHSAMVCVDRVERDRAEIAAALRPRIALTERLPEFVDDALRAPRMPAGLGAVLARQPVASAEHLAARFAQCARREECDRLVELFEQTGAEGLTHLREILRTGPVEQAAGTVGLLSRSDSASLERLLPARLPGWNRAYHDVTVRQLACGAAPARGRVLARVFPSLDRMVMAEALDEIGMSSDPSAAGVLLRMAAGEMPQAADGFLRAKAIESLGRLRVKAAAPMLRELVSARQMFRWLHPPELRTVAAQALAKIDPQWMRSFLPESGLDAAGLALAPLDAVANNDWARQRRYARVALPQTLTIVATTLRGDCQLNTTLLSLGGGLASSDAAIPAGTQARIKLAANWRSTVSAEVLVRDAAKQQVGFEIVSMDLEDRARLRRLIAGVGGGAEVSAAN